MKKLMLLASAIALVGAFPTFAADTSTTIVSRQTPKLVGAIPAVSYAHAMATAAAQSAGSMTFDVLDPKANVPVSKIVGCQTTFENVSGTAKLLTAVRSGRQLTITGGISDTIRVSDTVRTECVLKP